VAVDGSNVAGPSRVLDNTYRNAVYNWLSPEVLNGQPPTDRSDLYSYCVIVWEILHGSSVSPHLRSTVSYSYIYISPGSVATPLRCGGILTNHFIANFLRSVPLKEFLKIG